MANPLTPDQLVRALKAEGVKVREYPGWRTHNRNHKGPWGPVHGVMLHHTVTPKSVDGVKLCFNGYTGLPGPLCQGVISRDGTVHLIGNGRANHAGGGDPNVLQAVKDERYEVRPPTPHVGNASGVDGNRHFYGFECENLGDNKDPWPAAQVEAMVRASAAICRSHVWTEKSTIEHQEWSSDKSDPRGPGYPGGPKMRARIKERLAHGPSWSPGQTTTPKPPPVVVQPPNIPESPVALPNHLHLTRGADVTLLPGVPYEIYWDGEQADEGNQHGAGNKTVAYAGTDYALDVHLSFMELPAGHHIAVMPIEEGSPDVSWGDVSDLVGADTGTQLTLGASFTGNVRADKQLVIRVINMGDVNVTMHYARLSGLFWTA